MYILFIDDRSIYFVLLLQTLEQELAAKKLHTSTLLEDSDNLLQEMPYASEKVNEQVTNIKKKWQLVDELAAKRRKRLEEILNLHQYLGDCREIEADMNELEAPIFSNDFGHDEESVKELLKKEEAVEGELKSIEAAITATEDQRMNVLGENDRDAPQVIEAKQNLDEHCAALKRKLGERHQKLLYLLALFKLHNEVDLINSWLLGRRSQLTTYLKVDRSDDMERCKAIQLRFEGFEQELLANQERVENINALYDDIKTKNPEQEDNVTQEKINNLNKR